VLEPVQVQQVVFGNTFDNNHIRVIAQVKLHTCDGAVRRGADADVKYTPGSRALAGAETLATALPAAEAKLGISTDRERAKKTVRFLKNLSVSLFSIFS